MAKIEQSIEINATPEAVYERLTCFDEYPRFLQDVRTVRKVQGVGVPRLQWEVIQNGQARSFEAEIVQQIPGRRLALQQVQGPQGEAAVEVEPVAAHAERSEAGVVRTRVSVRIATGAQSLGDSGPEQVLAELRERLEQDLVRFKKHVEQYVEQNVEQHDARRASAVSSEQVELVGKTVAQTASEKAASAASAPRGNAEAGTHSATHTNWRPSHDQYGATRAHVLRGEYGAQGQQQTQHQAHHMRPWMPRLPSLPELWDLWQQPMRMARRASRDMGRLFDGTLLRPLQGQRGREKVQERSDTRPDEADARRAWAPVVETAQRGQKFVVCAELPGMRCDELQVEIKHDRLTIEGERRPEPSHELHEDRHSERRYGQFYRVVALPPGAQPESASAAMRDGVLEVTVPLAEYANRPRRLEVKPMPPAGAA